MEENTALYNFDVMIPVCGYTSPQTLPSGGGATMPMLLEFDWCVYDMNSQNAAHESQNYVKAPEELSSFVLTPELRQLSGIKVEDYEKAKPLEEILQELYDYIFNECIKKNKTYCIIVVDESFIKSQLPKNLGCANLKLQPFFFKFFEIRQEFQEFYKLTQKPETLPEMLQYLDLKETVPESVCHDQCKMMVRILNRMVIDGKKFKLPCDIYFPSQPGTVSSNNQGAAMDTSSATTVNPSTTMSSYNKMDYPDPAVTAATTTSTATGGNEDAKKYNMGRDRSRTPPSSRQDGGSGYVAYAKIRGVPWQARETEILDFFRGLDITRNDIRVIFDYNGRSSGEALIRVYSQEDLRKAFSKHLAQMEHRYIEVFESTEQAWMYAANSSEGSYSSHGRSGGSGGSGSGSGSYSHGGGGGSGSGSYSNNNYYSNDYGSGSGGQGGSGSGSMSYSGSSSSNVPSSSYSEEGAVLRMRGLPFSCTEAEVSKFFSGFRVVSDGIKLMRNGNRLTGEGFVIFATQDEAKAAYEQRNGKNLGHRYIELFSSSMEDMRNSYRVSSSRHRDYRGGGGGGSSYQYRRGGGGGGGSYY